jgi:hypothetical protein
MYDPKRYWNLDTALSLAWSVPRHTKVADTTVKIDRIKAGFSFKNDTSSVTGVSETVANTDTHDSVPARNALKPCTTQIESTSIPNNKRPSEPEIALVRNVKVRDHADLSVIAALGRGVIIASSSSSPQARVVQRPERFRLTLGRERASVGVQVRHEGDEPVFHVGC